MEFGIRDWELDLSRYIIIISNYLFFKNYSTTGYSTFLAITFLVPSSAVYSIFTGTEYLPYFSDVLKLYFATPLLSPVLKTFPLMVITGLQETENTPIPASISICSPALR